MRKIFLTLFLPLFFFSSCSLVKQGKEFSNLFNCKYSLENIKIKSLGGVDVDKINSGKIPTDVYFSLMKQIFAKDVKSEFEFYVSVYNPTDSPAGAQGMDWEMLIKDQEFADGTVDSSLFIDKKSSSKIKVNANINLFRLINSLNLNELAGLIDNKNWMEIWEKSGLVIKLKPWYKSGDKIKKYPGYITLKP